MIDRKKRHFLIKLILTLTLICIIFFPFVLVNPGERGVLMKFGEVQEKILPEGLHLVIPLVNTVHKLTIRVQKQEISAEASSKDLQEVYTDVALNWHIIPEEANLIFQEIGDEMQVVDKIINPAVEEILKAVMAKYTAEEIITKRGEVKSKVDDLLIIRLKNYHVTVDDISLVKIHFSEVFTDAVEAKEIAKQEAKRAEFIALKAVKEAEAKVNLAKGEAEAQRLIKETLTSDIIRKQAIEKWDGVLPKIMNGGELKFDVSKYIN
ncbi:prohibitin family protein [Calothrix sp. 336/3]|uniref:prohibitin family protein n=1 Tax=Calothrix sp. 336/3 TaxID=1337936 RepID=UPI0004E31DC8|nr:prohibitin family protein [Calothrix sp. 336/3]AKG24433.1 band 7 protein [Calothrix sp. 336/3]